MQVVMGAQMMCSFGVAPSVLAVIRPTCLCNNVPMANIMDFAPMTNIPPFGMCTTQSNPAVAAATAAAMGTPTPAPCVPVTTPWTPGKAQVLVGGMPALDIGSKCTCAWGGSISITNPGQTNTKV